MASAYKHTHYAHMQHGQPIAQLVAMQINRIALINIADCDRLGRILRESLDSVHGDVADDA